MTALERRHAAVLRLVERGRVADAAPQIDELIRLAPTPEVAARFRLTAAWIELDRGRLAGCARQLALARPLADPARADCLGGLLRCASGEHRAAVAELTGVLPRLRGDRRWLANALVGRGTAFGYLRRLRDADTDFAAAATQYTAIGEHGRAAACVHNRGFVALQAGDLPLALRRFGEAEAAGLAAGRHPEILVDRAQALVAAGLARDARPVLAKAAALLADAGRGTKLAEALLAVAQCAARTGQTAIAVDTAARAAVLFGEQDRPSWRVAAHAVRLTVLPGTPQAMLRVAAECDGHGWWQAAAELRLAADSLADVARRRHTGPTAVRALGWLARARLARDRRAVFAACTAGLRVVRSGAATMGGWELRAGMAGHAVELAELGLAAALRGGRARTVLRWTDRCRAVAGDRPAVLPPTDPLQAHQLVVLRSAIASGGSPARVRRLEQQVRALDLAGTCTGTPERDWTFADLSAALGEAALVCFIVHDGRLSAVSFANGRCRLRVLGSVAAMESAVRSARLGSAAALDSLLSLPGGRPLVVVPVGALHAVPWAVLPSCAGRPVSVAPSVAAWLRATDAGSATGPPGGRVWIAGPGLRHAGREAQSLHARYGGRLLAGRSATVAAALAAMDGADLVHVAAHGRFREDQPLFSCLDLSGGPLFGYDLQRLRLPPRRVVLSACDAGRSAVWPGGEAIGMATALLRHGTATVIASVLPVPDRQAVGLVTALHAALDGGLGPAAALATAQAEHGHLGFVCFGAG
ncbi:MAG TPA: CHAT domain-containing protein [Pseudonocardiaceae bacterium]|nr:CHAT domain-containing protein [Pseudonocardiaceae bacterium]